MEIYSIPIDWTDATENLSTTGTGTFDELTLTAPTQDYLFTDRADALCLQSQTSAQINSFELYSKDGDATDIVELILFGKGTPSDITNYEALNIRWLPGAYYEMFTANSGSGTLHPLHIYTGANTTQLVLNIDGSVSIATGSHLIVSQIGTILDTDLLQLASGALTVNGTLTIPGQIFHDGDADTFMSFLTDTIVFTAGNLEFLRFKEVIFPQDEAVFNENGVDVDFRVEAVGQANALFVQGSDGAVGVRNATPACALDVTGAISSATSTFSTEGPTDNVDVSGINTLFIDTSGNNVTIGGFVGGVNGQELRVVVIDATNDTILEHAEGTGNQDIYLHAGIDETLDGHYGGWNLVCNGTHWYDESHAKHV